MRADSAVTGEGGAHRLGRSIARIVLLLLATTLAAPDVRAQTAPTDAYTITSTWLRADPNPASPRVFRLPRGSRLALSDCNRGWCIATFGVHRGYVLQRYLAGSRPSGYSGNGRGYVNSRGTWVRSPVYAPEGQVPAGATAQCCDGSYSFSMSRRGTCSHHGGVCQWLGYR
jgi:uncharacterized protein YraI